MGNVRPNIGRTKAYPAQEGFVPSPKLKLLEQVSEGRGAWIFDFRFSIFDWGKGGES
jgi:hypothetical protein